MSKLKWMWIDRKYLIGRQWEAFIRWIVWRLPRKIIMGSYIRVVAHATTGKYGNTVVPELGMMEALERWDDAA